MNLPKDFDARIYLISWNGDTDNSDTFHVHIVFSRADGIPEFSSLLMPIASVILIVGYHRKKSDFSIRFSETLTKF